MILGFTASVGLEEMTLELIHQKFMAKLQLVAPLVTDHQPRITTRR